LHDDVGAAFGLAYLVDGHDVGVLEGGSGARLLLEADQPPRVRGVAGGQELHGDAPAQAQVARPEDLAHAAGAEAFQDLVVVEALADQGAGLRFRTSSVRSSVARPPPPHAASSFRIASCTSLALAAPCRRTASCSRSSPNSVPEASKVSVMP